MRKVRLQATPITEDTFSRQGWKKHLVEDMDTFDDPKYKDDDEDDIDSDDDSQPYFYSIPLPKHRIDRYAPLLISNASHELEELKNLGLKPGQYFVEMLDMDGLGFCTTEEELEILYRALTGKYIEE